MLDARALFYAVLVSLLIALLSAALVQVTYFMNMQQTDQHDKGRLIRNVRSGIALLTSSDEEMELQTLDLYGDGLDKIEISKKNWGLFSIGTSMAFLKKTTGTDSLSKVLMFGDKTSDFLKYGLYVTDQIRPVSLVGNAQIKGEAFLPKAGIKRGHIGGKTFIGNQLLNGKKRESKSYLPKLDWEKLQNRIRELENVEGTIGVLENLNQVFTKETAVISGKDISLEGIHLSGNIIIIASEKITIASNSELEDVILVAPHILVKKGFRGSFQAFAKNNIVVEEDCYLEYPSVLCLSNNTRLKNKTEITVGKNSTVEGMILAYEKQYRKHPTHISIWENAQIAGEVFVKGSVDLRGIISGSLSCKELQTRTLSSTHVNFLFDGKINRYQLPKEFASPLLDGQTDWVITKYIQ